MKKIILILILILLVSLAFYGQAYFGLFQKPCERPITYSLGSFDSRFDITQQDFLSAVNNAVNIWETPTGKDLFAYDPNSKFKINLIYDSRQEATDNLKSLGYSIDNTQASYDQLKNQYNQMLADYNQLKSNLEAEVSSYNSKKQAYEEQVKYYNQHGGADKKTAAQLNKQRDELVALAEKIKRDQDTLNSLGNNINAVVDVLNRMAQHLNLNVETYNTIGQSRGDEFEEGAYIESGRTKQIDIYEFENEERLVRVLAHELGHALGLEHIDTNKDAIMYRLNQGDNESATIEDITALKTLCGI